jgi:hypothetical protein
MGSSPSVVDDNPKTTAPIAKSASSPARIRQIQQNDPPRKPQPAPQTQNSYQPQQIHQPPKSVEPKPVKKDIVLQWKDTQREMIKNGLPASYLSTLSPFTGMIIAQQMQFIAQNCSLTVAEQTIVFLTVSLQNDCIFCTYAHSGELMQECPDVTQMEMEEVIRGKIPVAFKPR